MRLAHLFSRWSRYRRHRRSVQPRRVRLGVHAFEPRITPDVSLSHGHLLVNGNTDSSNTILLAANGIGGFFVEFNGRDFSFNPGAVTDTTVNTNASSDVFVGATLANVPTTINCTDAQEDVIDFTIAITISGSGNLDTDGGRVTVNGNTGNGNGATHIALADDQHGADTTYTVTFQSVSRPGFGGLSYSNISSLDLVGGSGNNTFNVQSTLAGTQDSFEGGLASDTFNLGAGTLDALAGHLFLNSGGDLSDTGFDSVSLADQASVGNHTYNIESPGFDTVEVSRPNFDVVAYDFPSLALSAGVGNDTFNISPTAKDLVGLIGKGFTLDGGGGSNVLTINDQNTSSTGNFFLGSDYFESEVIIGTQGFRGPHVQCNEMQSMVFNSSNTRNQITVQSVLSSFSMTVNAGIGVNQVTVGGPLLGISPGGGLDEINGLVTILGTDAGLTSLTLDDSESTATTGRTFLVQRDRVLWGFEQVDFLDIQGLALDGGSAGNTFAILSTPVGLLTTINAGRKNDIVHTGGTLIGDVNSIQGPLVVNGFINGNTTFAVFDQSDSASQTYTVTTTPTSLDIARSGGFLAQCTHLRTVVVHGGSGDDDYVINGVNLTPVTLVGGHGINTLTGPAFGIHIVSWNITGAGSGKIGKNLTFSGMHDLLGSTSTDNFQAGPAGSIAGIIDGGGSDNELSFALQPGPVIVNVGNQTAPQLHGGVTGAWRNIQVFIGSKSANDTLVGPDLDTTWFIGHTNAGFAQGTAFRFSFTGFENLAGGSGLDVFRFISVGQVTGTIDGGSAPARQGNWLDYSGLGSAVQVNLQTGLATGVGGKVLNVQNVHGSNAGNTLTGSAQGNILLGGSGNDLLTGGSGASLLIGDARADTVTGGSGGDILIGDTTAFDVLTLGDLRALMGILAEWQSADSYATRFSDINTGTGGGGQWCLPAQFRHECQG